MRKIAGSIPGEAMPICTAGVRPCKSWWAVSQSRDTRPNKNQQLLDKILNYVETITSLSELYFILYNVLQ